MSHGGVLQVATDSRIVNSTDKSHGGASASHLDIPAGATTGDNPNASDTEPPAGSQIDVIGPGSPLSDLSDK